ncbi:MAG TPA: hypothetical protein VGU01_06760 [Sphingomicrobium sp.]|nr:hypothetical protein [Sphingomicrobium sp.]
MKHFGTVQSFNETTGHGYIRPENSGRDLGFERSEILWDPMVSPRPGVRLSYSLSGRNGQASAIDLQIVRSAPQPSTPRYFSAFRSATEEAATTAEQHEWENEGGHMSSTAGQARHIAGAMLPYVVTMKHDLGEATEHPFATMRDSEAFIKRNTPVPCAALSSRYDQPASDFGAPTTHHAAAMNDEQILARLKVIDQRLRRISTEEAASVWATGLANTGFHERERLRLIAETERILDELDGKSNVGTAL